MGPISELLGISYNYRMKIFDSCFACFSTLQVLTFFSQKHSPKGGPKSKTNCKIDKKTLTRSSLEIIPEKRISKVWKSYPLQRFKPISKGPRYTKKHCHLDPKWTPELQIVRKKGTQKNCKKQAAKKSSKVPKVSQIGDPRGGQSSANL